MEPDHQMHSHKTRRQHVRHFDDNANPLLSWSCVKLSHPLIEVVKMVAVIDFVSGVPVRGVIDTIITTGLLIAIITLNYTSVQLSSAGQIETSDAFEVAHQHFLHNRNTLILILGFGVLVFSAEIPLTVLLYKATKKQNATTNCSRWLQYSGLCLFLNLFIFPALMVYAQKAELIRDDLFTDISKIWLMVYGSLFRVAIYDVCKAGEIIVVLAFLRELKDKKRQASHVQITTSLIDT